MDELLFWIFLSLALCSNSYALFIIRRQSTRKQRITSNTHESGFSLAEIMVAAGLVAGLALTIMRISANQAKVQKKAEQDLQITSIVSSVQQALLNEDSCKNTLAAITIANGTSIPSIKNRNGGILFQKNTSYQGINVESISIKDVVIGANKFGELNLSLQLQKVSSQTYGAGKLTRTIPLKVELDSTNKVKRCYSATENAIDTAKSESCRSIGGIYNFVIDRCDMANFPAASSKNIGVSTAYLKDWSSSSELADLYVNTTGDTMTGALTVNATINASQAIKAGTQLCVGTRCRDFSAKSCTPGQLVKTVNADGSLVCQGVSCPNTKYFEGLDSAGNPICRALPTKTCPTDYYVSEIKTDGSVTCSPVSKPAVSCSSGQYIQSISSSGIPTCISVTSVQNVNCPAGQAVGAITNGISACRMVGGVSNISCPVGQVLVSIVNGVANCRSIILSGSTPCITGIYSPSPPACPSGYTSMGVIPKIPAGSNSSYQSLSTSCRICGKITW